MAQLTVQGLEERALLTTGVGTPAAVPVQVVVREFDESVAGFTPPIGSNKGSIMGPAEGSAGAGAAAFRAPAGGDEQRADELMRS